MSDEALAWLAKAEQHCRAAEIIVAGNGPSGIGCFLCQQAAETALKGLLVWLGQDPPRTHDLVDLHRRGGVAAAQLPISVEQLAKWSYYAVAPRYPGFGDDQTNKEIHQIFAAVVLLLGEIRKMVE